MVAVGPIRDADKLFLAWGQMHSLDNLGHISVRIKVEHSVFGTLKNQRFGSKFVEEVANPSNIELRWLTQYCTFYIFRKMNAILPQTPISPFPLSII